MAHESPTDVLEVLARLDFGAALEPDDPRYVPTEKARGSMRTLDRLAMKLGLRLADGRFFPPPMKHILFFGHIGSGKTTELRRYCQQLCGPDRYLVIEVSVVDQLDANNFEYPDLLMALARALFARLEKEGITVDPTALAALDAWFWERVKSEQSAEELTASLEAGVEVGGGIPFFAKLFAKFTTAFKTNVTYKDDLRKVVRNTYAQFSDAFNGFIRSAEEAVERAGVARRFLFVVDGTDKLGGKETRRFFSDDAEQLLAIQAHLIYTAPLALKYEGHLVSGGDSDLFLPMIKVSDPEGGPFADGIAAMQAILLARADRSVFADEDQIRRLVEASGGHPRELLRLLKLCCEFSESDQIDAATVERAVSQLASEYRRFLEPTDFETLARIDRDPRQTRNDERTRRLLYTLALLEYDDGEWRRSHPVVRQLAGYLDAASALDDEPAGEHGDAS